MNDQDPQPNAEMCAHLVLDTVPRLFHMLKNALPATNDEQHPHEMTMGQLRMLETLSHRQWTLSELAEQHQVTVSTMSRLIDVLVKRNWVARHSHPDNRRQVLLTITATGEESRDAMRISVLRQTVSLFAQLSPAEQAQLYAGIAVLRNLTHRQGQPTDCALPKAPSGIHTQPQEEE
jgi:DNA-binding MarR family transcriptional regulator